VLTVNPRYAGFPARLRAWLAYPLVVPALMAVIVCGIGAQVACSATIPTWSNDEPAHLGYVAALAEGKLPTIDTPTVDDPARFGDLADRMKGWDTAHDHTWTANHPPLYHLLLVPLWWLSQGEPDNVFIAMRLLNTIGFAAWVLLVAVIARELVPRRPAVAALAAVATVTPTLAMRAGFLLNDGFGSAATLLGMLMAIRMLRDRVTPTRVALAALAGAGAAGTRAPGVLWVAVCTVVLLVALWRRDGWRTAIGTAAVVGGVPALATGWFYLRNLSLYGDLTGQGALLEKFERTPVHGLRDIPNVPSLVEGIETTPALLVALLVLAPLAALVALRRRDLRVDAVWVLLVLHAGATLANITTFLAAGGGFHDRYFMPIAPLLATWAALGMLEVGRWWHTADEERRDRVTAAVWSVALLGWLAGALAWMERRHVFYPGAPHPVGGVLPTVLVGIAALAGVLVVVAQVASPAARRRRRPAPVVASAPEEPCAVLD
jgi:hypothetical protein